MARRSIRCLSHTHGKTPVQTHTSPRFTDTSFCHRERRIDADRDGTDGLRGDGERAGELKDETGARRRAEEEGTGPVSRSGLQRHGEK